MTTVSIRAAREGRDFSCLHAKIKLTVSIRAAREGRDT